MNLRARCALAEVLTSISVLSDEEKATVLRLAMDANGLVGKPGLSPGQIEAMITKAIRDQTGRVVAGQINDPNSVVSRSLLKNIHAGRIRE